MSSVRVPPRLLARLHEAAPHGMPLAVFLERLLDAGGVPELRNRLERERREVMAHARVERLRRAAHRSVMLAPDEQLSLAAACRSWHLLLVERRGRSFDPSNRVLKLQRAPTRRRQSPLRLERTGMGAP